MPAKTRSAASSADGARRVGACAAGHRLGLAGERGHVDLQLARDQPRIGRESIPLVEQDDVTGHQLSGVDLHLLSAAAYTRPRREQSPQGLGCRFGLAFLGEREGRVEADDRDDRQRQRAVAAGG